MQLPRKQKIRNQLWKTKIPSKWNYSIDELRTKLPIVASAQKIFQLSCTQFDPARAASRNQLNNAGEISLPTCRSIRGIREPALLANRCCTRFKFGKNRTTRNPGGWPSRRPVEFHLRAVAVRWTPRTQWRRDVRRSRISWPGEENKKKKKKKKREKKEERERGRSGSQRGPCRFTYFNGASCTFSLSRNLSGPFAYSRYFVVSWPHLYFNGIALSSPGPRKRGNR